MAFSNFFIKNKNIFGAVLTIIVVVGIIFFIKSYTAESFDSEQQEELLPMQEDLMPSQEMAQPIVNSNINSSPIKSFSESNEILPEDLLPTSSVAAEFEEQFPVGCGDLTSKNFLTAGFNTGINTVSSSLRNANVQLRSDPYIPIEQVGPWQQSTVLPDFNRKQFEIGSTA